MFIEASFTITKKMETKPSVFHWVNVKQNPYTGTPPKSNNTDKSQRYYYAQIISRRPTSRSYIMPGKGKFTENENRFLSAEVGSATGLTRGGHA